MAFKKISRSTASLGTPESLLHDLRMKTIKGPLAHQADMWRAYLEDAESCSDVALELPTGSGKTLVGLVLAEWRRRKQREKVVYLCPTKQLAHQVAQQAKEKYGLDVEVFVGGKSGYSSAAKVAYNNSSKIAITTYSSLFNINPFFNDADVLIFDDAHAAENYVSELWSLEINIGDHRQIYDALVAVISSKLDSVSWAKLNSPNTDSGVFIDKLPTPDLMDLESEITEVLDSMLPGSDLNFSWSVLKGRLSACHLYFSNYEILIRPWIPPTMTHPPFANAKQRIYMSATLGQGGDLERIMGVKKIKRLPTPDGWDQQGIGRRFFIFPSASFEEGESLKLVLGTAKDKGRSLILCTNFETSEYLKEKITSDFLGALPVYDIADLEADKSSFLNQESAVAIAANRYDGIDFPDDDCRILVVSGLPANVNLQERFIATRLGANVLFNERINTRVVQAIGRCTRSTVDYSVVFILGDDLSGFFMSVKKRAVLHPELQAEIEFGIDQSSNVEISEVKENIELFLNQGDEWLSANDQIVGARDDLVQEKLPCVEQLRDGVCGEVEYQYLMWDLDFLQASSKAREVESRYLDSALKGYRSWWKYIRGSSLIAGAGLASPDSHHGEARRCFADAARGVIGLSWLKSLAYSHGNGVEETVCDWLNYAVENLESNILGLGTSNDRKFSRHKAQIIADLYGGSGAFEASQVSLGRLLGYECDNSEEPGAPDPWWVLSPKCCIVFEDHSDADVDSKLSIEKARQVASHDRWIYNNVRLDQGARIIRVLVSPVSKAHIGALVHLEGVYFWNLSDYKAWAQACMDVIGSLRAEFPSAGDVVWRAKAAELYDAHCMSPEKLLEKIVTKPAAKVLVEE